MAGEPITSLQNPRVKAAAALRDRRERDRRGQFLIDGVRELSRAIAGGVRIDEAYVCERLCAQAARDVLATFARENVPRVDVSEGVFAKLAFGDRQEGIVAVARMPECSLAALRLPERPLVAVLEGVEKPGNIGAVLRTADAAGVSAVIVADAASDLYNPNCIRASLGTLFTVPVAAANAADVLAFLRDAGVTIVATRVDAEALYTATDLAGPVAIVLGSEAHGLSAAWQQADVTAVRLPMLGVADSLNVSATAAVLFYEALRQRTGTRGGGVR